MPTGLESACGNVVSHEARLLADSAGGTKDDGLYIDSGGQALNLGKTINRINKKKKFEMNLRAHGNVRLGLLWCPRCNLVVWHAGSSRTGVWNGLAGSSAALIFRYRRMTGKACLTWESLWTTWTVVFSSGPWPIETASRT